MTARTCASWFSLLIFGAAVGAQPAPHNHSDTPSTTAGVLLPGMGSHHHPIATRNPEAQQFFDQGLILAFGFNHDEAARSFRHAMQLDPDAAMPCWGLAWVLGPRYNMAALTPGSDTFMDVDLEREKAAFEAVQRALRLSAHAPRNEQHYIQALAQRYSADPHASRRHLLTAYKDAMSRLDQKSVV